MVRAYHSRVSPKGQITLPAEIRRRLDIKPRDTVAIELEEETVKLRPKPKLRDFYQKIPALEPPRTWEEIEDIVREEITSGSLERDLPR